jgi:hypothetical protein
VEINKSLELAGIERFGTYRFKEYVDGLNNIFKDEEIEALFINNKDEPDNKEYYFFSKKHIIKLNEFTEDEFKWSFNIFKNDTIGVKVNDSNLYLSNEGFHSSNRNSLSLEATLKDSNQVLKLHAGGIYCEVLWHILVNYLI